MSNANKQLIALNDKIRFTHRCNGCDTVETGIVRRIDGGLWVEIPRFEFLAGFKGRSKKHYQTVELSDIVGQ